MPENLVIDKSKTAIVVIDLQKGIASRQVKPYSSGEVIGNASRLISAFRKYRMPVFLVHVLAAPETALKPVADEPMPRSSGATSADWSEFLPEMTPMPSDIVIAKRQWGAFYGTDLDLQLRRRGLNTIVLCGIATDYGVESTARFAYEYGYNLIFAGDAMASMTEEQHNCAIRYVFRRMGRVRKTAEILKALEPPDIGELPDECD